MENIKNLVLDNVSDLTAVCAIIISVIALVFNFRSQYKNEVHRQEDLETAKKNRQEDLETAKKNRQEDLTKLKKEFYNKEKIEVKKAIANYIDNWDEMPPQYFSPQNVDQLIPRLKSNYGTELLVSIQLADGKVYNFMNIDSMLSSFTNYYTKIIDEMILLKGMIDSEDLVKEIDDFIYLVEQSINKYMTSQSPNVPIVHEYNAEKKKELDSKYGKGKFPLFKNSLESEGFTYYFITNFSVDEINSIINYYIRESLHRVMEMRK